MKKNVFILFILMLICPLICSASEDILISEAAGHLTIPDGFVEVSSSSSTARTFYNESGESIRLSVMHFKDVYPNLGEEYADQPLYSTSGELCGVIGRFVKMYKEIENELSVKFDLTFTNRGECASIKGDTGNLFMMTVINRYEAIILLVSYKSDLSPAFFLTPYTFYPNEQPLKN